MQFRALLAFAATLSVALAAPVNRLNQREEASPAVNTMYVVPRMQSEKNTNSLQVL